MLGIIIPKNIAFQKIALKTKSTGVTYPDHEISSCSAWT